MTERTLADQAGLVIRSLLRNSLLSDHVVMPEGERGIVASEVVAKLDGVVPLPNAEQARLAFEAMNEFIDRVDRGEVRSTRTYTKFKSILGLGGIQHTDGVPEVRGT